MRTQIICLTLAIVLLPFFSYAQWIQTNGPFGGDIRCFAVSGGNLFAGTFSESTRKYVHAYTPNLVAAIAKLDLPTGKRNPDEVDGHKMETEPCR